VQPTTSRTPPIVTCDGTGVVSHAGTVLLAELADRIGLTAALSEATDSLRERRAGHDPGRVLVDVAVAIADGAVSISDVQVLADQQGLHGPAGSVASTPTIWRVLAGIAADPGMLAAIRQGRAQARDRAWLARGELTGAELPGSRAAGKTISQVVIDLDATLITAHSPGSGTRSLRVRPLATWSDGVFRRVAIFEAISGSVRYRLANPGDRKVGTGAGPVEGGVRRSGGHRAAFGRLRSIGVPVVVLGGVRGLAGRSWLQPGHDGELERDLERFLTACDRPAWEVTREDVDRVVAGLAGQGLAASTRRGYVQAFKGFHAFLVARKSAEIESVFGVRLVDPIDEFNAAKHVGSDSPSTKAPPAPQRMEDFFDFLKGRIATARKYTPAGRDYALFRTLYLAGLRAEEAASLDIADVHFGRGPFGKLHVRFGKGAKTSGPRPRWVPMLDGLDLILRWYLDDVRPRLGDGPALFCDEGGGRIHRGTIRNRLAHLLECEATFVDDDALVRFSPHGLRHACATRNYERGVDLVAIQQMLGHWHVGTTMRYVTPSATFIEDAYRRAVSGTLASLEGDGHGD